ncbi:MAG: 3D-(3,5/4)-trihydroxycyclohexane-1,2-dione acylhydrolase (decyclizing) [Rhodospirillaceae bacterium]|nr:3D-(3,5/4)-trihydroxycyclohexane-1,2-dione acylhydrolase (decyclizing) [Rhodospirillaceae bacterium]MDE0360255.1 3D-(3,5/4)-trihydroxycyclohexane-1,2-dione acylhydrolase (decyclizing) [Rhodospirillaceae bacterium]
MKKTRLTMAQAIVRYLIAQRIEIGGEILPLFHGVFAIFGHGNVAGLGEALFDMRAELPTFRAHNEQGMAHAAIAFAKASRRRRMMACTTSIGPGATNMVTAAALAHVNRLPVLLLPGDVFANRTPDPVLQQLEYPGDPTISVNDCFRPVSRYFDRITRPEQIITSLPAAISTLTDPADCGPATLSLCQDVQTEAFDYPESLFAERVHRLPRRGADRRELGDAIKVLRRARRPLLIAGGGVHYSGATAALRAFAEAHGVPVAETQAGKGALSWNHPNYVGAIGVTGSDAANQLAQEADVILAVGTRLQDFTTASRTLIHPDTTRLIQLNVARSDAGKHEAQPLVTDAMLGLQALQAGLEGWQADPKWQQAGREAIAGWNDYYEDITSAGEVSTASGLPSDPQVLGAVKRASEPGDIVVCAAGGLPGELHKLWRTDRVGGYHLEYGYSCMGYEIAGGMGVKMACPDGDVIVLVGDGSYMMLNSELATSVMLGHKIIVVVLDNGGYGCINRLQQSTGSAPFNNLFSDCAAGEDGAPSLDFAKHASAMGAASEHVENLADLELAVSRAKSADRSCLISLRTDPDKSSSGGFWWDVAVPEVSERAEVNTARADYLAAKTRQPY